MTFTIAKKFTFEASHQLDGLGPHHKCARLHGHNYEVDVELSGPLDDAGMVYDYGRLAPFAALLAGRYDHRHLNDVVPFNPTAERLAEQLHHEACAALGDLPEEVRVTAVRVRETPRSEAEYRP